MRELHAPCGNCPFLKVGAIELRPGRLAGIIRSLADDRVQFFCHKTTSGHEATEDGDDYVPGRKDRECAGAMIYRLKLGRMSQMMRICHRLGMLDPDELMKAADNVIDPHGARRARQ